MPKNLSILAALKQAPLGKVMSARQAIDLIAPGDTLATSGFIGIGFAENIAVAIEELFLERSQQLDATTDYPHNLTLVYAAGQGDGGQRGLNHFGHAGLVKRVVGGHWGLAPKLGELAIS
ncbi:MAG TPA: hypothetical protein PLM98_00410, partial [Thiolinea sp.]|nr:hypothetical protein [Thiolinea sp.]